MTLLLPRQDYTRPQRTLPVPYKYPSRDLFEDSSRTIRETLICPIHIILTEVIS